MTNAPDDLVPPIVSLRRALDEQERSLTGPTVPDVVCTRVQRVVGTAHDIIALIDSMPMRQAEER